MVLVDEHDAQNAPTSTWCVVAGWLSVPHVFYPVLRAELRSKMFFEIVNDNMFLSQLEDAKFMDNSADH